LIADTIVSALPSSCASVRSGRIFIKLDGRTRRFLGRDRGVGRAVHLVFRFAHDRLQFIVRREFFGDEERRELRDRIALGFRRALRRGLVQPLVVRLRV
jgi:hypothetical protein